MLTVNFKKYKDYNYDEGNNSNCYINDLYNIYIKNYPNKIYIYIYFMLLTGGTRCCAPAASKGPLTVLWMLRARFRVLLSTEKV